MFIFYLCHNSKRPDFSFSIIITFQQQMKKQLFIALEGIDGSGKSTQIKLLAEKLRQEGHRVYSTFEPTASLIGSLIRNIFNHRIQSDHKTIAALFLADRLDHLQNETDGILKKMREGYTVITDRYYFSSYAYHGAHIDLDWVIRSNAICAELLRPDMNIYIDISIETSLERLNKGRESLELFETRENIEKVRNAYLESFRKQEHLENIAFVDGEASQEIVAERIWDVVKGII